MASLASMVSLAAIDSKDSLGSMSSMSSMVSLAYMALLASMASTASVAIKISASDIVMSQTVLFRFPASSDLGGRIEVVKKVLIVLELQKIASFQF